MPYRTRHRELQSVMGFKLSLNIESEHILHSLAKKQNKYIACINYFAYSSSM